MDTRYTAPHEVAYYECDFNGTMTLTSLVAVAIKVSEEQSELLGRGTQFIHDFGLTWIITNYQLFIERLPHVGETIKITTEAQEYNKYFCYRNFWITTESGEELVRIETIFALMNIESRKVASVPEEIIAPYHSQKTRKIKRFPKIEKVEQGQSLPYRVRFYDIDSNQHVNNAVYFNWMLDALGYDFLTQHEPSYVHIRFEKEVEYGNEVASHFEILTEEKTTTHHEIKIGEESYCQANISWKNQSAD